MHIYLQVSVFLYIYTANHLQSKNGPRPIIPIPRDILPVPPGLSDLLPTPVLVVRVPGQVVQTPGDGAGRGVVTLKHKGVHLVPDFRVRQSVPLTVLQRTRGS